MVIRIVGNTNSLQQRIESFRGNLRTEMINKRARNKRALVALQIFCVALLLSAFVFYLGRSLLWFKYKRN